jgi:signal transduction histidine kinase
VAGALVTAAAGRLLGVHAKPLVPTAAETAPALGVDELEALVDATREIAEILDLEPVLQLIVDRVRALVGSDYAALGIASSSGRMERFITSGVSPEVRAAIGEPPRGHGLLGLIIREGRSYRIPRIADHPDSYGFPPNHPPMTSFLGVPVTVHGRSVGNLYLTDKRGATEFSESDRLMVEMFALRAGIAIDNATLHEQVQRLAVVEERERISRDLHDGVIQSIYGVALSLEEVAFLVAGSPDEATERVDRAIDSLNQTIREIRNFILGLRSELLHGADLRAGVATLAEEFGASGAADIELDVAVDPEVAERLPIGHRVQLLQMTREALSNAVRHARAAHIVLALRTDGPVLELRVEDDGIGFDSDVTPPSGHLGLANLRHRAASLGDELLIDSRPGRGTRVRIRVPISLADPEEPVA